MILPTVLRPATQSMSVVLLFGLESRCSSNKECRLGQQEGCQELHVECDPRERQQLQRPSSNNANL